MLVGAIFINSIDVVMQRFHRDLHQKSSKHQGGEATKALVKQSYDEHPNQKYH